MKRLFSSLKFALIVVTLLLVMGVVSTEIPVAQLGKVDTTLETKTRPQTLEITDPRPHMITNPAATYCAQMGYSFQTTTDADGNEIGVCVMPDETQCDAWGFLTGTCGQQYSYCAQQGYEIETRTDGADPFSPEYAVCIDARGDVVGTVSELTNLGDTSASCGATPVETEVVGATTGRSGDGTAETDYYIAQLSGLVGTPPSSWDWRNATFGGVTGDWTTPVKNQGQCGSCWAYAAVGISEASLNLAAGDPTLDLNLSEEYLISNCAGSGAGTCCGGWHDTALASIRDNGIPSETCMPSVSNDGTCACFGTGTCSCDYSGTGVCSNATCSSPFLCSNPSASMEQITETGSVENSLATIKQALIAYGPLAVAIDSSAGAWDGDVLKCADPVQVDHSVSIVGYNDAGQYWIVKNSWGATWNGDGYFKVGYGQCFIEDHVAYAVAASGGYTISGYVRDSLGVGIENVRMSGLPFDPVTNSSGFYTVTVLPGWSGTVHPEKVGYDFSSSTPTDITYTDVRSNRTNQNYAGAVYTPADVLVVDDDNNIPDSRSYYTDALDALTVDYLVWDTYNGDYEPDAAALSGFDAVIWFSGQEYGGHAGPGSAGEAALTTYLNSGGSLFISSQDYIYDRGITSFMTNYLGAATSSVNDPLADNDLVTGANVYSGLGSYTVPAALHGINNYSDFINPATGAVVAFTGDLGNAAVSKDNGTYRTTYLGFPLELLGSTEIQAVLERFLTWDAAKKLTLTSSPVAGGTISANPAPTIGTRYHNLTDVELTAVPATGYAFSVWSGGATGTSNPVTVTLDADKSITATFLPCYTLTTTVSPAGYGTITANPASDPGCAGGGYRAGTVVTLTATNNPGRDFTSWSGSATDTSNPVTVTMTSNKTVTATFTPCYSLSTGVVPSSSGTVDVSPAPNCPGGLYRFNTSVTITANPATNYNFISWSGSTSGSTNPTTFTMTANKSVTANFNGCFLLTKTVDPTGGGTITASPGPNCAGGRYTNGTVVRVTATASSSPLYAFANWSGDASGTVSYFDVTMDTNKDVTASFLPCYDLTITTAAGGTGSVTASPVPNCGTKYLAGTNVTLTAKPTPYNYFVQWTGSISASTNPFVVEMDGSKTITVNFLTTPSIPTLATPVSGALLMTYTGPTLDWSDSAPNFDHYELQVATNNTFTEPLLVHETSLTSSSYIIPGSLSPNTPYYWRVRAYDSAGQTRGWSSLRSFRTVLPTPVLAVFPELPAPASGTTMLTTMPTFDWEDVSGVSGFNIQIAKDIGFVTQVLNVSTTGPASSYTPTVALPLGINLYWRVRSLGVNGPSDWSTVRLIVSANPPAIPTPSLPAPNSLVTDYTPTLSWFAVSAPVTGLPFDHYQIQIDSSSTFADPVDVDQNVSGISNLTFTPSSDLTTNTTYYWRLRTVNTGGQFSQWSVVRTFRTALAAPSTLIGPANGSTVDVTMPVFTWNSVDGASGYTVQISKNDIFTMVVATGSPTTATYTPTVGLPGGITLYWRVQTRGANGPGPWSVTYSFTSANPPSIPGQIAPAVNFLTMDYTPTFTWSVSTIPAGAPALSGYEIEIASNTAFSPSEITSVVGTSYTPASNLDPNTTYYWRVRALNVSAQKSQWSATRTFRTALLPPSLESPVGGVTLMAPLPTLDWTDVAGATGFNLVISRNDTFTSLILNINLTGSTSSYTLTAPLPAGTLLYWRVRTTGTNGPSDWSGTNTFISSNPAGIPTLVSPAPAALVTDYTPSLTWSVVTVPAGTAFDYYEIEIDTDVNFQPPVVRTDHVSTLSTPTFAPDVDLLPNQTYYWRVRSYSHVIGNDTDLHYSMWSSVRSFRTSLLSPVLSSPANGSTMLHTLPTFDWNDVAGVTGYTLQISRNDTFSMLVLNINTVANVSTYTPTVALPGGLTLYWRVNSLGINGPSAWSEVRSFTSANPPGIPSLLSPVGNALVTDYTPTLTWNVVTVPTGVVFDYYQVQISATSSFESPVIIDANAPTLSVPNFTPPDSQELNANTTYYWRVRSVNTDGQYSQWSTASFFRTSVRAPGLLTPADGETVLHTLPTFDWDDAENAIGYTLQVSRNNTFTLLVGTFIPAGTTSSYTPTAALPGGMTLYWRVQTRGASGASSWSSVYSFNIANPPSTPVQLLPANTAVVTDYTPTFTWSAVIVPAGTTFDHYWVQVASNSNFASPEVDAIVPTLTLPSYTPVDDLDSNTTYYWRVKAFNTLGQYSQWSTVRTFRTAVSPPVLTSLIDGETALTTMPVFTWESVASATGYNIQISRNNTFTWLILNSSTTTTATTFTPPFAMPTGITLYWRVQAKAVNGPSDWSETRSFISANPPSIPTQNLLGYNAITTDYTPTFTWYASVAPTGTYFDHYQLQVHTSSTFTAPLALDEDIYGISTTSYTPSIDFNPNTTYYWRIRSYNSDGQFSQWSTARPFRTAVLPPVLALPSEGTLALTTLPVFDWDDVVAATGYTIQIARNNTFTSMVTAAIIPTTTSTYTATIAMPVNTVLYWRVQANAVNGPSAWSDVRSFTSANPPGIPSLTGPAVNFLTTDFTPTLTWGAVTVPSGTMFDHYRIQIATNTTFTTVVLDEDVSTLSPGSFTPASDLNANTLFYWRVSSYNTVGQYSQWSASRTFRTTVATPTLSTPADGEILLHTLPTFDWGDVDAATGYTIQIARDAAFTSFVVNISPAGTVSSYTPTSPLPTGVTLYWRIQTKGASGLSAWSEVRTIITANPPSIPTQVSPAPGVLLYDYTPTLTWKTVLIPTGTAFDHYQIQIATDTGFSSTAVDADVTDYLTPSYTVSSALDANTAYYWRVRAFNTDGQYSQWSTVRTFRMSMLTPVPSSPSDGSIAVSQKPIFDWNDVTGATSYTIQISRNASFTDLVVSANASTSTYTPVVNLPAGTTVYWRVRANGPNGPTTWSTTWTVIIP